MEVRPLLTELERRQVEAGSRLREKPGRRSPTKCTPVYDFLPLPITRLVPRNSWYLPCKAILDFSLASVLFVLALPFIGLAALLVRLTSNGPVFYTQTRVGLQGKLFTIYKIRTMVHECESLTGPRWAMPGDPRITTVGLFLRKTHTDELPQLWNVLRGDMSLIGPRPERPEFLPKLERVIPGYRKRLSVRPGITGLAQVNLGADTNIENVRRKIAYDLYYIQRVNPWLDLRILTATFFYALGGPGGWIQKLSLAPYGEQVEKTLANLGPESFSSPARDKVCA